MSILDEALIGTMATANAALITDHSPSHHTHPHALDITRCIVAHTVVVCLAAAPSGPSRARPAVSSPELGRLRGGDLGGGVGDWAGRST